MLSCSRLLATSSLLACLLSSSASSMTTDYYVNWVTGDDLYPGTTTGMPFKTITQALLVALQGDTIRVTGGINAVHKYDPSGGGELFPLAIPADGITIVGSRAPHPTIDLNGAETTFGANELAAIFVDGKDGFVLEDFTITATNFNTDGVAVAGVLVDNLPDSGSITIRDCTIDNVFNGIVFRDDNAIPSLVRTATILDTTVQECGPFNVPLGSSDRGHAGIRLVDLQSNLDLTIKDCTLKNNHDALEPGVSTLTLLDSSFTSNESGLEYASVSIDQIGDGSAVVSGCLFQLNAVFAPNDGGVLNGATAGIVARNSSGLVLKVGNTDFDRNQIGALIKGGTGTFDFGTYYPPPQPYPDGAGTGGNSFITDDTNPWYPNQAHSVSYCGLFNATDGPVSAVGNTWSYVAGDVDFNQGANSNGTYLVVGGLTVPVQQNWDQSANYPKPRSLSIAPGPQQGGNYSTGQYGTIVLDIAP